MFNGIVDTGYFYLDAASGANPKMLINNGTNAVDPFRIQDNGTTIFEVLDGGSFRARANDGGHLVWNPAGAGTLKKQGGDEFWRLSEESMFNGIVDTGYFYLDAASGANPKMLINNGTNAVDPFRIQDNGTTIFEVLDGGSFRARANDGGHLVWNPAGAGTLKKQGGDEFWSLGEESLFTGIVDVNYLWINDSTGLFPSFVVRNTEVGELNKDDLVEFRAQNSNSRHRFSAANSQSDVDYAKYTLGDPAGYRIEINAKNGEAKVLGGDNWWSLGEEIFLNSYYGEMGSLSDGLVMWWNSAPSQRRVTIDHLLRLTPTDSPGTCNAAAEGDFYFDDSLNELCDCDGLSWQQIDGGGAC